MNSPFKTGVDTTTAEKIVKRLIATVWGFKRPQSDEEYAELVDTWRDSLNFNDTTYPKAIYLEAVTSWLSEATADSRPPLPGDIVAHCKKVMAKIDKDPVRGPKMRKWQEDYREARIEQLIAGGTRG